MRIGQGYDVHAFAEEGDSVVLGGVRIPYSRGFKAHSDGDVLLHALCDALLGAAALGDIGRHFPDSDPRYRGMDSRTFLRIVHSELQGAGWRVGNVDATIVAQAPRMAPYIGMMRANI
ncbi:MAG TPA: 2-C-methyl-D-erythritol 2,4-cyclodiphosphate synthase, partial [Gammaproteobacteria bacterium]|nr:2-C-methyl-D-erythritol 2,4-cyclodiphosphate synthase [Gammaproteobacteria bacterium]